MLALHGTCQTGVILDHIRTGRYVDSNCFLIWFAVIGDFQTGNFFSTLTHDCRCTQQDPSACHARHGRPDLEASLCRSNSTLHIFSSSLLYQRQQLTIGGIDGLKGFARRCHATLTVDEQLSCRKWKQRLFIRHGHQLNNLGLLKS